MEPRFSAATADASVVSVESDRRRVEARLLAVPVGVWLTALVLASALARFVVALRSPAPWIFPDEWIYAELARNFGDSGHFLVWGTHWPVRTFGPLYPALISPAYRLTGSVEHAYMVVRAVNCVLMSLAAIPAYLLARRLLDRGLAFLAAVLVLLVPSMVYTTKVMTENLAYPVFLATVLAFVRALERPSTGRQAAALGLIALSFLARGEMLVLLPAYLCGILLLAILDGRSNERRASTGTLLPALRSYRFTWLAVLCGAILVVAAPLAAGRSPAVLLGGHEHLLDDVRLLETPRWLLYQLAELDLAVGVVPFAAFLLVLALVLREPGSSRAARIFIAVAAPVFACLMLLGAVYGTQPRPLPHVFERYVFYVMPLLLIAVLFWLQQGLPRPRRWTAAAAGLAFVLPATLPYATLLNRREWGVSSSTPGLVPWALLRPVFGVHALLVVVILALTASLVLLFLRTGPKRSGFVAMAVLCNLWIVTLFVATADGSVSGRAGTYQGSARAWVDEAVGPDADVGALWTGSVGPDEREALAVLETQFFNRSVRAIYHLDKPIKEGIPSRPLAVRGTVLVLGSGPEAGRPLSLDYVFTNEAYPLAGRPVARNAEVHLVLYRVGGPVRVRP
jgi:dolichyl-phosphate-mannose-protein mannosyltransferase